MRYLHLFPAAVTCVLLFSKPTIQRPVSTASTSSVNNSTASNLTSECGAECLHELLPLMARQGAAFGMGMTLKAYNAVDWCNAHVKCTPVIEDQIDHIAERIVKILPSHIYSDCGDRCVYEAGRNATNYATATSITWLSNILGRTSLVSKDGNTTDSLAKLQWLRWQLGMEHNNFTFDYNLLNAAGLQRRSQYLGPQLTVRNRLAERGAKDILSSLGQHWTRLYDRVRNSFSRLFQKIFHRNKAAQQGESKTEGNESPSEVSDTVLERQLQDFVENPPDAAEEAHIRSQKESFYSVDPVVDQVDSEAAPDPLNWKSFQGDRHGRGARELGLTKEYAVANQKAGLAQPWTDKAGGSSLDIWVDNNGRLYSVSELPSGAGPPIDAPGEADAGPVRTVEIPSNGDASSIASEPLRNAFNEFRESVMGFQDNDLTRTLPSSEMNTQVELRTPGTRYVTAPQSPIGETSSDGGSQKSPGTAPKEPPVNPPPPPPENPDGTPGGSGEEPEQPARDPAESERRPAGSPDARPAEPDGPPVAPDPQTKPGPDIYNAPPDLPKDDPFRHIDPGPPPPSPDSPSSPGPGSPSPGPPGPGPVDPLPPTDPMPEPETPIIPDPAPIGPGTEPAIGPPPIIELPP